MTAEPFLRDLLINLPPTASPLPSGRRISQNYRPWLPHPAAEEIVRTIWGDNPDIWMKDYRASQLIALFGDRDVDEGPDPDWSWGIRVIAGPENRIRCGVPTRVPDGSGQCHSQWRISWSSPWIYLERELPAWLRIEASPSFEWGWSAPLMLLDGDGSIQIAQGENAQWTIEVIQRPQLSPAHLYRRLREIPLDRFWDEVAKQRGNPAWSRSWKDPGDWIASMRGLILALLHTRRAM